MRVISPQDPILQQLRTQRINWRAFIDGNPRLLKLNLTNEDGEPFDKDEAKRRIDDLRRHAYQAARKQKMTAITNWNAATNTMAIQFVMMDGDEGADLVNEKAVRNHVNEGLRQLNRKRRRIERQEAMFGKDHKL